MDIPLYVHNCNTQLCHFSAIVIFHCDKTDIFLCQCLVIWMPFSRAIISTIICIYQLSHRFRLNVAHNVFRTNVNIKSIPYKQLHQTFEGNFVILQHEQI